MKFLIDANLPPALCAWLKESGHEASHVFGAGAPLSDIDIWRVAAAAGQTIITKDVDFPYLSLADDSGPLVVLVRCGNLELAPFRIWFQRRSQGMFETLEGGARFVELI